MDPQLHTTGALRVRCGWLADVHSKVTTGGRPHPSLLKANDAEATGREEDGKLQPAGRRTTRCPTLQCKRPLPACPLERGHAHRPGRSDIKLAVTKVSCAASGAGSYTQRASAGSRHWRTDDQKNNESKLSSVGLAAAPSAGQRCEGGNSSTARWLQRAWIRSAETSPASPSAATTSAQPFGGSPV